METAMGTEEDLNIYKECPQTGRNSPNCGGRILLLSVIAIKDIAALNKHLILFNFELSPQRLLSFPDHGFQLLIETLQIGIIFSFLLPKPRCMTLLVYAHWTFVLR